MRCVKRGGCERWGCDVLCVMYYVICVKTGVVAGIYTSRFVMKGVNDVSVRDFVVTLQFGYLMVMTSILKPT